MSPRPTLVRPIDAAVIGASAGGIGALIALLPWLPAALPAAVLIVLHRPRHHPSSLLDVLQPRCRLPLCEAVDKLPVRAGTVYLAPPDCHLLVDAGPQLALSADDPVRYSRPSIDVLFESVADVYGRRLLGVILSGGNEDGASGLRAVYEAGGTTVVQDPATADAPIMPRAALGASPVDFVLAPEEIGALLAPLPDDGGPGWGATGGTRP